MNADFAGLLSAAATTSATGAATATVPTSLPAEAGAFLELLDELRAAEARQHDETMSLQQALELVMLCELLGIPVPAAAIAALRGSGMELMADDLEARNRRLAADPDAEHRSSSQQERPDTGAQRQPVAYEAWTSS